MNVKMNTDFLKNFTLPPIQLPKVSRFKTHKIFTTAPPTNNTPVTTTTRDTLECNTSKSNIKPRVISPAKISTLSSLVDGAPTYDYSFGGAIVPDHIVNKIAEEEQKENEDNVTKSKTKSSVGGKLSKRFSKQYKELSEFKLKDIFSKKTVVRTTEIQSSNIFRHNYDEKTETENRFTFKRSDSDDLDIEVDRYNDEDIPSAFSHQQPSAPITKRRQFVKNTSEESTSSSKGYFTKAASLQALSGIMPNDSSLWRMKKSKSKSSSTVAIDSAAVSGKESSEDKVKDKRNRFGKRSLSRQDIDAALDKAKKSVNSKFRQLKFLQSRTISSKDSKDSQKGSKKLRLPVAARVEVIDRRGSFDSFDSEAELPEADLGALRDEWLARKMLSSSVDGGEIPRCLLGQQDSIEEIKEITQVCIVSRPAPVIPHEFQACIEEIEEPVIKRPPQTPPPQLPEVPKRMPPPIPIQQDWIPNSQIIVAFYQATSSSSSPSPVGRRSIFPEFPRGHSRKPSMDSTDSDSWIPEKLRGLTRSQAGLNKINESSDAWKIRNMSDESYPTAAIKTQSVDIFKQEGEEAFEDFDKVLQNAPVIVVKNDEYADGSFDQKSIDFSTTDDDEDDIDPDISTVLELPDVNINCDHNENIEVKPEDVIEETEENCDSIMIPVPRKINGNYYLDDYPNNNKDPNYDDVIIGIQQPIHSITDDINDPKEKSNASEDSEINTNILEKNETLVTAVSTELSNNIINSNPNTDNIEKRPSKCNQQQNQKFDKTLVKHESLRRMFADELETEHLTDVSVNKLISRFEKRKSSSSADSPKVHSNRITVEAIIETNQCESEIDLPEIIPKTNYSFTDLCVEDKNLNNNNNNTTIVVDKNNDSNNTIPNNDNNINTTINNNNTNTFTNDNNINTIITTTNNNNNNNNNNNRIKTIIPQSKTVTLTTTELNLLKTRNLQNQTQHQQSLDITYRNKNNIKGGRSKSIEWAKSSKSINKTIDIQLDNDAGEIFYSFEEEEDSRRSNSINGSAKGIKTIIPPKIPERTIRHVYNVAL